MDQTIDGFGVWDAFQGSAMTGANADTLFSPTSGAGLSLLGTLIPSGASDSPGDCSTVNSGCAGTNTGDMTLAVARGARIFSAAWTPPASMKSNGSYTNGGSLLVGSYGAYATWLTNYVESVQTYFNITPYGVSVQEEPDQNVAYDSAIWSPQNLHDFILNNLGPSFASAGLTTKIMMPQASCADLLAKYANTTMEDSAAAAYVGIVADEDFCNNQVSYTTGGAGTAAKPDWMVATGPLGSGAFDPSIGTALTFAQQIHSSMTLGWAAWCFWTWHSSNPNQQLIDISTGTVSKTLYAMGQWSKFVRPGWVHIDSTANPQTGVYVTAFKSSSGSYAVVAINTNHSATSQTFTFSGFPSTTSITPWVTSSTLSLATQPAVAVEGDSFSFSLPAESVTTFVGAASGSSTGGPVAPPSLLSVSVK
ncbi:MAG: glycoside hydrolase family 30 beta sandwich domain-containing protein [Candidatus Acidiferrales bacterium]